MKRKNKHLNKRKALWNTMEWPYPGDGRGFFHKTHSDSPDNGTRLMENKIHKHQKRKKRRDEKNQVRELLFMIDSLE